MQTVSKEAEKKLLERVNKYYTKKHGKLVQLREAKNLIGEKIFREAHFEDGYTVTFCLNAFGDNWFKV